MKPILAALALSVASPSLAQSPSAPATFGAADQTPLLVLHAVGAQVYECQAKSGSALSWMFREPIATLVDQGKTVGRHFLGPSWALADGTLVKGRQTASAPGAHPEDIALLKLAVVEPVATGPLAGVATVLRLNTKGGALSGGCAAAGELRAVPYAADYVFLR